jgi:hypothetical protein
MTATVLLTLGRLPKALEIARALAGAGCRVIVAEPFRRHVCHASRSVAKSFQVTAPATDPDAYLAELLAIIEAEGVDAGDSGLGRSNACGCAGRPVASRSAPCLSAAS